jgi:hypothetical protein
MQNAALYHMLCTALEPVDEAVAALTAMADLVAQEDLWASPAAKTQRAMLLRTLTRGLFSAVESVHQGVNILRPTEASDEEVD